MAVVSIGFRLTPTAPHRFFGAIGLIFRLSPILVQDQVRTKDRGPTTKVETGVEAGVLTHPSSFRQGDRRRHDPPVILTDSTPVIARSSTLDKIEASGGRVRSTRPMSRAGSARIGFVSLFLEYHSRRPLLPGSASGRPSSQTGSVRRKLGSFRNFRQHNSHRAVPKSAADRQDRSSRHESHIRRFILVVRVACYAPPIHPTAIDSWLGFEQ